MDLPALILLVMAMSGGSSSESKTNYCVGNGSLSHSVHFLVRKFCTISGDFVGSKVGASSGFVPLPDGFLLRIPTANELDILYDDRSGAENSVISLIFRRLSGRTSYIEGKYDVFEHEVVRDVQNACGAFVEVRDFDVSSDRFRDARFEMTELVLDDLSIVFSHIPQRLDLAILEAYARYNCGREPPGEIQ